MGQRSSEVRWNNVHEILKYTKLEALDKGKVFLLCLFLPLTTGHKRHILENLGIDEPAPSNQKGPQFQGC